MNNDNKDKRLIGVDVKRFQYEEYANNLSDKKINIKEIIEDNLFKRKIDMNCIMINLEKDYKRYENTINEFKKISLNNFSHLKATYWKNKKQLINDLSFVLNFLSDFNSKIELKSLEIDQFSKINDDNIHIQDGPLACYISHLRSMIYGYTNFKDYTIITEDDISVANTENIEKYIKEIPDDWDILMLNACSKNKIYNNIWYKFDDEFHSTHFYIINNKCFPLLFKNLYPITDQVDVLISNLHKQLNIYNIQETVYQKNISTNTQNNLHVIFNSPHYEPIRERIKKIENSLSFFIDNILSDNTERNKVLSLNLMYDILYEYVLHHNPNSIEENNDNKEDYKININEYIDFQAYIEMLESMRFFLQCSKKGIKDESESVNLISVFLHTIESFKHHNVIDNEFNEKLKAYGFGSTAHVYLLPENNIVVKKYNDKLRWTTEGHDNSLDIFKKELSILKKIQNLKSAPKLISFDVESKTIKMSYCGESLYDNFNLPKDWQFQITDIFNELTSNGIFYPEFRLQNILVLNEKITFVDYGLAEFKDLIDNTDNLNNFIKYLDVLNSRLSGVVDRNNKLQLITTFLNNIKIN
jgi:tRNA A-37 threonylcarbamoyl transferase component Bud32